MNKYIKLLMEDLNLKVNEEFEILSGLYNPYHFTAEGQLIDEEGDENYVSLHKLFYNRCSIKKIVKLTDREIGMLKAFKMLDYDYIYYLPEGRAVVLYSYKTTQTIVPTTTEFTQLEPNRDYKIDELLNRQGER